MGNLRDSPLAADLLEELPMGVIVVDAEGKVVLFNRYEERMAQRRREDVVGRSFFTEVAPSMRLRELAEPFARGIDEGGLHQDLELSFPFPFHERPRDVLVRLRPQLLDGKLHGVFFLEDVSASRAVERTRARLTELLVHDLKNPLAVAAGNLELIADELEPGSPTHEAAADGLLATERLRHMLGTMLDLNRLQTGEMPIVRRPSDARQLLEAVAEESRILARSAGVEIDVSADEGVLAPFDEHIMRRALDNLVDNAIRMSPEGGRVRLEGRRDADAITLRVIDEGPGVPAAMRDVIFEPHARLEQTPGMNVGLGLTFVRLAARAHGGRVTIGDAPKRGAMFSMVIPAALAADDD